jgi:hypothetical protein
MGTGNRSVYNEVWKQAQFALQHTFGMKLVELPLREKVTVAQRRAAQRSEKNATSSKSYILMSTLPDTFRHDSYILPPPKQPTTDLESTYVGIYTFVISLIYLCGGIIPEPKLDRQLEKLGIDKNNPIEKTDKLLLRMIRDGYIVKVKETRGGEEVVEYTVGPRGKLEVGQEGVFGMVKTVYGDDSGVDDIEARLKRSLGMEEPREE